MVPSKSFVVAASARTGSTLLCRALQDSGVAGRPEEYFLTGPPEAFPPGWRFWEDGIFAAPFGPMNRLDYLALVHRLGTSDNGVFSAKVMWNYVPWIVDKLRELPEFEHVDTPEALRMLFPNLSALVLVTRRDRVRQAVSWLRASQDGVWVVSDTEPATPSGNPSYDRTIITGMIELIGQAEQGWRQLAADLGLEPIDVVYEELVDPTSYHQVISGVLDRLGLDASQRVVPPPRTTRQGDHINDDWADRYVNGEQPEGSGSLGSDAIHAVKRSES